MSLSKTNQILSSSRVSEEEKCEPYSYLDDKLRILLLKLGLNFWQKKKKKEKRKKEMTG